jgi:hypothetical protein
MKNLIYYRAIADIVRTKEPRIPPTDLKSGYMKLNAPFINLMLYQSTIHKDIKTCMKKRSRKQKLSITFDCTKSEIEHVIIALYCGK